MFKLRGLVMVLVMLAGTAYARKFPLAATASVAAARGDVEVDHDSNGNTRVRMKVEFLAPPNSLTPPASVYVVWLREQGAPPVPWGQMKVEKNRKASFESVTPAKNFDLFVTAEQDATIKAPTGPEVLKATIQP
jgi:hypothetical protein